MIPLTLLACSSCSWVFQDTLPKGYDGRSVPTCSTSSGWAVLDGVFAVGNAIGAVAATSNDSLTGDEMAGYVIGSIVWGVIHVASASSGFSAASACEKAQADYFGRPGVAARDEARRHELEKQVAREQPPVAVPPQPRGFFCASSPSMNFCVRDKDECVRTRDISIAAAPDLTLCALVESAWCYGDRCSMTQNVCDEQSAKAGGLPCVEVR